MAGGRTRNTRSISSSSSSTPTLLATLWRTFSTSPSSSRTAKPRSVVSQENCQPSDLRRKKVKEGTQGKEEEKKQVILNISMRDWSLFVKNLNVTKAAIPHLKSGKDSSSTFKKPRTHS